MGGQGGGERDHLPGRDLTTEIVGTWGPEALHVMRDWPLSDVVSALGDGYRLHRARRLLDLMDTLTVTREINTGTRSTKAAPTNPDVTAEPYQRRRDELQEIVTPGYLEAKRAEDDERAYLAELEAAGG